MHAKQRLYLTADRDRLVADGDPDAAFLYAAVGDEIPVSAADRFGLVEGGLKKSGKTKPADSLIGSSVLPATFDIKGETIALGAVVARAHKDSRLSVEDWNAQPDAQREDRLVAALVAIRAEAAKPKTLPKPAKAPKAAKAKPAAEDKESKPGADKGGQSGNGQPPAAPAGGSQAPA